jgi:tetratricopeptide (TPR) repeat protein/transcriptional regulator with XRE-family HTH domain
MGTVGGGDVPDPESCLRRLGKELRKVRIARGLSQREVVRRLGLSAHSNLVDYELGRRIPPADIVSACEALYKLPSGYLERLRGAALAERASLEHSETAAVDPAPPATPRQPCAGAPRMQLPAVVAAFTGRTDHLKQLDMLLDRVSCGAPGTAVIAVISGTAGVGKTTLAVHWAHQAAERFPDGQLYVNLRSFDPNDTAVSPAEALRGFLGTLGVPPEGVPATPDGAASLYRSLLANRQVLIVLDNARDADQVRPLLPGAPGCLILVTSRNQLSGLVVVDAAHSLVVDPLSRAEARSLLAARLGRPRVDAEPDAVDEIITRSAGLPLALAIVAARAATHPRFPLAALAGELCAAAGGLDGFRGTEPAIDISAVLSWSYRTLRAEAARLFRQLGLHAGPDIAPPAAAGLAGAPLGSVRRLLAELADANLISEHVPGRYAFHDLLRAYAAEQAHAVDSEPERREAARRLLDHYLHTAYAANKVLVPHRDPIVVAAAASGAVPEHFADGERALAWFAAERPVLAAAVRLAEETGFDAHAWQLAWTVAQYLHRQGHWHDLATTQHIGLDAARRLADEAAQAHLHRHLGLAYIELCRFDDARAHFWEASDLFHRLGVVAGQAHAQFGINVAFDRQSRHEEALRHALRALDLYRAADHRVGQANALNGIGWLRANLGDHEEALRCCQQALALHQELDNPWGQAHTWDSLGFAHHQLGDYVQALACYRRSLDLFRTLGDRFYATVSLTHLGDTHHVAGDRDAARHAWQQALDYLDELGHLDAHAVHARLLGLDRPHTLASRSHSTPST